MWRRSVLTLLLLLVVFGASAQVREYAVVRGDTLSYNYTPIDQTSYVGGGSRETFGRRLYDYQHLGIGNERNVKFSLVGAPAYSTTTGWRLTLAGNMDYYLPSDIQRHSPSHLTLYASASLTGYYRVELDGYNRLDKHILRYGAEFKSQPTYLYGLDYASALLGYAAEYTDREYGAWFRYEYLLPHNMRVGAVADYLYQNSLNLDVSADAILADESLRYSGAGVGLLFGFNNVSRSAERGSQYKGFRLSLEAVVRPNFLSSMHSTLYEFSVAANYYARLWRGAGLALDIYGEHHSKETPWMLRAELGGDYRMRGYYEGRFNGNSLITVQLELRQHIWNGIGAVVWGGAGTVFSHSDKFSVDKILPTYGVGLRYELTSSTVVRFDVAFGRDTQTYILGMSEAF